GAPRQETCAPRRYSGLLLSGAQHCAATALLVGPDRRAAWPDRQPVVPAPGAEQTSAPQSPGACAPHRSDGFRERRFRLPVFALAPPESAGEKQAPQNGAAIVPAGPPVLAR